MQISEQVSQEAQIIYQEDQVVWAKVRGYPWWPAFVDKMGQINDDGQTQYTVYFFGDDMHSVLGASKLRRFCDHYTQCYLKAKTNKKLMLSIQKAQQRLQQNDQNIQIYETLRNSLKNNKKRKNINNSSQKQISTYSSQQKNVKQNNISSFSIQNLINDKFNDGPIRHEQIQNKQIKMNKNKQKKNRSKQNNKRQKKQQSGIIQQKSMMKNDEQIYIQEENEENLQQNQNGNIDHNYNNYQGKQLFEQNEMIGHNKMHQTLIYQQIKSPSSPKMSSFQSEQQFHLSNDPINNNNNKKKQVVNNKKISDEDDRNKTTKKRGRPKKVKYQSPKKQQNISIKPIQKHKYIKKAQKVQKIQKIKIQKVQKVQKIQKIQKQKQQNIKQPQNQIKITKNSKHNEILNSISQLLNNRQQLITYLNKISITPSNVKQILDLDVSLIIQKGPCTVSVINLLQIFKTTLLRKYFPDDLRYQKKYQRLMKKKKKILFEENKRKKRQKMLQQQQIEQDDQDQKKQQSKEDIKQNNEQKSSFTLSDPQMRLKTISKLQKFLKRYGQKGQQVHQNAIKIQSYFEQYDNNISTKYREIAYKVLSCLKDKQLSVTQVIQKLQSNQFQ